MKFIESQRVTSGACYQFCAVELNFSLKQMADVVLVIIRALKFKVSVP